MKTLKFEETKHSYYCNDENYYQNISQDFKSWEEFKEEWEIETLDIDMNFVFRFDITNNENHKTKKRLDLFFMQQRKGIFLPVRVMIKEKDMQEVSGFLNNHFEYFKNLWKELG